MKVVYNFLGKALIFTGVVFVYVILCSLFESKIKDNNDTIINKIDTLNHIKATLIDDSANINISEVKEIVNENYINNSHIIDKTVKNNKIVIDKSELNSIIDSNYKINIKLLNELEKSQKTNINLKNKLNEHIKVNKIEKKSIKLNETIDKILFPLYIFIFMLVLLAAFKLLFKSLSKWLKIK